MNEIEIKSKFFELVANGNVGWLDKFLRHYYYFDINSVNDSGQNALHVAKGASMVKYLIDHRVNLALKDVYGKTPADYAEKKAVKKLFSKVGMLSGAEYAIYEKQIAVGSVVEMNKFAVILKTGKNMFTVIPLMRFKNKLTDDVMSKLVVVYSKNNSVYLKMALL